MAATAQKTEFNGSVVDLVKVKVTKGNELTDLITETFDGSIFAPAEYQAADMGAMAATDDFITQVVTREGMALGREPARAVRISKQIAVLGARGDYVDFILDLTSGAGTSSYAKLVRCFMVQALDYSGVPVAVQHSIFGKYSPFLTPTQPISKGMLRGIDRQEIELVHNVVVDSVTVPVNQEIRGSATARLTALPTGAGAAETELRVRAKPSGDGVFVIPRGAIIWAGAGKASDLTTTLLA